MVKNQVCCFCDAVYRRLSFAVWRLDCLRVIIYVHISTRHVIQSRRSICFRLPINMAAATGNKWSNRSTWPVVLIWPHSSRPDLDLNTLCRGSGAESAARVHAQVMYVTRRRQMQKEVAIRRRAVIGHLCMSFCRTQGVRSLTESETYWPQSAVWLL